LRSCCQSAGAVLERFWAQMLTRLAPHLGPHHHSQAVQMAATLADVSERGELLEAIAPQLSAELLQRVPKLLEGCEDELDRQAAFVHLATRTERDDLLERALELLANWPVGRTQTDTLSRLVPFLPARLVAPACELAWRLPVGGPLDSAIAHITGC